MRNLPFIAVRAHNSGVIRKFDRMYFTAFTNKGHHQALSYLETIGAKNVERVLFSGDYKTGIWFYSWYQLKEEICTPEP